MSGQKQGVMLRTPKQQFARCGSFDSYIPDPNMDPLDDEARWVTINVFGREQAISDNVLVPYQFKHEGEMIDCCFSELIWQRFGEQQSVLTHICLEGMRLLAEPHYTDTELAKKRVIIKGKVWVILDREGLMFLRPEEY